MTRTLLTARPHPVRRPTQRGAARPVQRRAGAFPTYGPLMQRQEMGNGTAHRPAGGLASHILGRTASGRPLPETTRIEMESRLGADFSAVKIHTDGQAAQISRALDAQAFTLGNDVFFDRANYAPGSAAGGRLLAHELSHVVQQQGKVSGDTVQRAAKEPAGAAPAPTPPVDCATEITPTRTCHNLIGEMIAIQADITYEDRFIKYYESGELSWDTEGYAMHVLKRGEHQAKFNEKERVRVACCPQLEVPPPVPTPSPEPAAPAAPSASPTPKGP